MSGECSSAGVLPTERPKGQDRSDDCGKADGGEVAKKDRWRTDAHGHFPQVEDGMRAEPQGRDEPQADATIRLDEPDAESEAEKQLNQSDVANEVLIEETCIGYTRNKLYHASGAISINRPLA